MKPISISLRNFRSVREDLVFQFPDAPGLYYMRGVNAAQPRLEGNGVGKSTLWDAMTWAVFGKTARGLGAGDVCTWGEKKGTRVALCYEDDSGEHELVRTWGPISVRLDGEDVSKLDVHALSYDSFLHSTLMAQGQPMFLDLDAPAKAKLFSDVLNLDVWDERSKRASERAQDVDRELRRLESQEAALLAKLETLVARDVSKDRELWEQERSEKIEVLTQKYRALIEERKQRVAASETAALVYEQSCSVYSLAEAAVNTLKPEIQRADDELVRKRTEADKLMGRLSQLREQHKHIGKTGVCPTCGQDLPEASAPTVCAGLLEPQIAETGAAIEPLLARVAQLSATLVKLRENLDALYARENSAHRDREAKAREAKAIQRDIDVMDRDLDRMEDEVQVLEEAVNPFDAMSAETQKQLTEAREGLETCQGKLRTSRERYALLLLWVKGFKEVRLGLIGDALTSLEIEVNSALDSLGLPGWEIRFDVDAETKSGAMKRGFAVTVKSPDNEAPVPWKAWSGGESQRLRLAGTMGLANLIRAQCGVAPWLEVWDEPTAWLSPQGVVDLLDSLSARAHRERMQIWVVDHRTLGYGHFDGVATITRTAQKTTISME